MGRQHPGDWRWRQDAYYTRQYSILVIDAHEDDEEEREKRKGQRVPFGFGRVLVERRERPAGPQVWEGDGA